MLSIQFITDHTHTVVDPMNALNTKESSQFTIVSANFRIVLRYKISTYVLTCSNRYPTICIADSLLASDLPE